jgi:hypothetical protein
MEIAAGMSIPCASLQGATHADLEAGEDIPRRGIGLHRAQPTRSARQRQPMHDRKELLSKPLSARQPPGSSEFSSVRNPKLTLRKSRLSDYPGTPISKSEVTLPF